MVVERRLTTTNALRLVKGLHCMTLTFYRDGRGSSVLR